MSSNKLNLGLLHSTSGGGAGRGLQGSPAGAGQEQGRAGPCRAPNTHESLRARGASAGLGTGLPLAGASTRRGGLRRVGSPAQGPHAYPVLILKDVLPDGGQRGPLAVVGCTHSTPFVGLKFAHCERTDTGPSSPIRDGASHAGGGGCPAPPGPLGPNTERSPCCKLNSQGVHSLITVRPASRTDSDPTPQLLNPARQHEGHRGPCLMYRHRNLNVTRSLCHKTVIF